jgi:hypothetical protein
VGDLNGEDQIAEVLFVSELFLDNLMPGAEFEREHVKGALLVEDALEKDLPVHKFEWELAVLHELGRFDQF